MSTALSIADLPKVQKLVPGMHVYFTEAVFYKKGTRFIFQGDRHSLVKIIGAGLPGEVRVEILKSKGANPDPAGIQMCKQVGNILRGYECDECTRETVMKSGGHLVGIENGRKVELDTAEKGGMGVGSSHAEGGIKGDVAGIKKIEFERKEPVLVAGVSDDQNLYNYNGKKMRAIEIASDINQKNGGVSFSKGGQPGTNDNPIYFTGQEVILTAPVSDNKETYDFEGEKLTGLQIASRLNERNGGVKFA